MIFDILKGVVIGLAISFGLLWMIYSVLKSSGIPFFSLPRTKSKEGKK